MDSPPKLKDLYNIVTPDYAAHWKVIGTLLDISSGRLDGIEKSFPASAFWCCNDMLKTWLETDTSATWRKLIQVIDSPGVMAVPPPTVTGTFTAMIHPVPSAETNAGNSCIKTYTTQCNDKLYTHVHVKIKKIQVARHVAQYTECV